MLSGPASPLGRCAVYSDCPRCGADNLTDRPVCPSCHRIVFLSREDLSIPSDAGLLEEDTIYDE
jgi:hypothetical protein